MSLRFDAVVRLRKSALLVAVSLLVLGPTSCATSPDLATRLAQGSRSAGDKARDAGRKPAGVLAFLGIEEGMTAIDLFAGGGYYTEVLAEAVGPKGKVYAHNIDFVLKMRDGVNDKEMTARLANGRLPNVVRLDREIDALGLVPGSIDFAITALNIHDIYNSRGPEATRGFLAVAYGLLAPGGVLGIIDHAGNPGAQNESLHRIEESIVVELAREASFVVEASSDLLRNPSDDRTQRVFAEGLRGQTDRFVVKLRKPI